MISRVNDDLPLDGVRVIEIAGGIAAAFATRLLAGFGADVTRIEGFGEGPPLTDAEEVYLVAGKHRIDGAAGGTDLDGLVLGADIVVADDSSGRLAEAGV